MLWYQLGKLFTNLVIGFLYSDRVRKNRGAGAASEDAQVSEYVNQGK